MPQLISAGLLMCRFKNEIEFFLVHPGGPFFRNKNAGVWGIPKGIPDPGEDLLHAAVREFEEETGITPNEPYYPLGNVRQKRGKTVHAWSFLGEWDPTSGIRSNTFRLEWPPRSGQLVEFPEQDRADWMDFDTAKTAMIPEQIPFLERARDIFAIK